MDKKNIQNLILSLLIPCLACVIQWLFWDKFQPFIWFLFYPSVFFSAQIGGRRGGIAATLLSVFLVVFFFVNPIFSLQINKLNTLYSVAIFTLMGFLFSELQARFTQSQQKLKESESTLRKLNNELEQRVKQRAIELQKNEQRFQDLFETMTQGVVYQNSAGAIISANPAAERILGLTLDQMQGRTSIDPRWKAIHEDGSDFPGETHPAMVALQTGQPVHNVVMGVYHFESNAYRWINVNAVPRVNPGEALPYEVYTTFEDITERKHLEESLRESEQKYTLLFQKSSVPVLLVKLPEVQIADNNDAAEKLTGYTRAEMLGKNAAELGLISRGQRTAAITKFEQEHALAENEMPIVVKTGEERIVVVNTNPLTIDGKPFAITTMQDITERKRAEEQLRESEEFLRLAYEATDLGIWKNDLQTGSVEFDERARSHYGFDTLHTTLAEVMSRLHPDDVGRLGAEIAAATAPTGNGKFATEYRVTHPDGSIHWLAIGVRVIFAGEGEGQHAVMGYGTSLDITERKQAEEALREREQKLNTILNLLPVGISILDQDHKVTYANAALGKILGITKEGLARGDYRNRKYLRADGSEKPVEEFASTRVFNERIELYDVITGVVKEDAQTIWTSVSAVPVDFPDWKVVLVTSDITGQKRVEQTLQRRTEELEQLLEMLPSAIWIAEDAACQVIRGNRYANELLGVSKAANVSQSSAAATVRLRQFSKGRELAPDELPMQVAARTGQPQVDFELRIERPDRATRTLIGGAVPLFDAFQKTRGAVAAFFDITDLKTTEEELRRSNAELEQFAYVASHDLQEPLRAVAGMVQLLGQRYKGQLDDRADEYIGHAVEASQRMQKLINDLLDYSRVDRYGKPFEPTQLEQSLKHALANLQTAIQESGVQITHDPLPTVMADPTQMTQVLQNLIGNAIKFRGKKAPQIHVAAKKSGDNWQVEVRDNGIGIAPQYFERIFLVFQRLHTRSEYPGTGIGLSLCKKIVERHHGQIWVESQPEQGSTFYFTIPEKSHEYKKH